MAGAAGAAGAAGNSPGLKFDLPLKIVTDTGAPIKYTGYQGIFRSLNKNKFLFSKYIKGKLPNLKCVEIQSFTISDGPCISIYFVVKDEKSLDLFHECTKGKAGNDLSAMINLYAFENSLELAAGCKRSTRLKCSIFMPEKKYLNARHKLRTDDGTSAKSTEAAGVGRGRGRGRGNNDTNKNETKVGQNVRQRVQRLEETSGETSLPAPGSYPKTESNPGHFAVQTPVQDHFQQENMIPSIRHCFIVYIPNEKDRKVEHVMIESGMEKLLNAKMEQHCGELYKVSLDLPAHLGEHIQYSYCAKFSYYGMFFNKKNEDIWSFGHNVGSNQVHRDIWGNEYYSSIDNHLRDIIFYCSSSDENNINDLCMQIETLCRTKLQLEQATHLIKNMAKSGLDTEERKCLFAIALGNLLYASDKLQLFDLFDKNVAAQILKGLRQFKLCNLPISCKSYIKGVCFSLCMICYGEFNLISYMNACYPFYGEEDLEQALNHPNQPVLCGTTDNANADAVDLCQKLYKNHLAKLPSETKSPCCEVIGKVLRKLPFETALHTYAQLKNDSKDLLSSEEEIQLSMYHSICTQTQLVINTAKKTKGFEYLLKNWELIATIPCLVETQKVKFEEELLMLLEKLTTTGVYNINQILKTFCEKYRFFDESEKRKALLTVAAEAQNPEVHALFVALHDKTIFTSEDYDDLDDSVFKLWFEKTVFIHSRSRQMKSGQDELIYIFGCLSDLMCVGSMSSRTDLINALEQMAMNELQTRNLKDVLRKATSIEKLSEEKEHAMKLYKKFVEELLKKKHKGPPDEILMAVCGSYLELIVDTRLTASLACSILDVCCDIPEIADIDAFELLLQHNKLWKLVFKGKGIYMNVVRGNKQYRRAEKCLLAIVSLFKTQEVQYSFVKQLENKSDIAKDLIVFGGIGKDELKELWKQAELRFKEEKDNLSRVKKVLTVVYKKTVEENKPEKFYCPPSLHKLLIKIKDMETTLSKGKLTAKECMLKQGIWQGMTDLPRLCEFLVTMVESKVFWNVCLTQVCEKFIQRINEESDEGKTSEEEDNLEGVCELFGEMSFSQEKKVDTFYESMTFLNILLETGGSLYKEAWRCIQENEAVDMAFVLVMFDKSNINAEVLISEKVLGLPIKLPIKETLDYIGRVEEIGDTVEAMRGSLGAFGIDLSEDDMFIDAVESFEQLLTDGGKGYTFSAAGESLRTVFQVAKGLSTQSIGILSSLGKSISLLEFLKTIVDEDIRNLIDAVEDISEQYVRESTVSGLIEIKRFLHPLLRPEFEKKGKILFSTIEKQSKAHASIANSLPAKINECMENIHNLKSLYNNVANRGEQTKETIKNIVEKGSFNFFIDDQSNVCNFTASYKHEKSKTLQSKVALSDLRSRALLLMNSERKVTVRQLSEELELFITYIDLCIEIADLVYNLYASGHANYINFTKVEKPPKLSYWKVCLSEELRSWQQLLNEERKLHYLMNFVQGPQIHTLQNFLDRNVEQENVETLLKYIHPNMQADTLKIEYAKEKACQHDWNDQRRLYCLGMSLHYTFGGLGPFERVVDMQDKKQTRITDIVQNSKLLVAQLEESSLLVVKTILALFMNTTGKLPEANQICFCTTDTTFSELQLFLARCLGAFQFYGLEMLFCIANVEVLPNEIQFKLVEGLRHLKDEKDFLLAIVCRGSKSHPFIDELTDFVMIVRPSSEQKVRDIFLNECPNVCTVTSDMSGLGKTNTIYKMAYQLQMSIVSLQISGSVYKRTLIERLQVLQLENYHVLHLNIGYVENHVELDSFLFELIILRHVTAGTVSVSLPTLYISIEIANTMRDSLRNSLQTAMSFKRIHLCWNNFEDYIISSEVQSPVQVVCHFLNCLENGELDKKDLMFSGTNAVKELKQSVCRVLLKKYISATTDLTFSVVNIFLNVLADQLKKMSCSSFFRTSRISDMIGHETVPTIRSTLTQALVEVSKEFSSRSVNACRSIQASTMTSNEEESDALTVSDLASSATKRLEGMIRWEDSNHLIYVFHNQNIQTISPMYRDRSKVPHHIRKLFEGQMKKELQDFKGMDQIQLQMMLQKIARTNPKPIPKQELKELSASYALTPDNLLKMVLIMLRIKANVPVVVMGETGCGKTSLIRYLASICEFFFDVLNIHAGVEEHIIISQVHKSNKAALENLNSERWLFLDEINTCEHLGLISDVICHHQCLGTLLSPNLIVMGACNPYKLRTSNAISTAGLQGKVKTDELSRLVYRVLPLPEMLVDYVWDFGSLSENDESTYIERMVEDVFPGDKLHHELFSDMLSMSQQFVRVEEKTSYSVSLRDVQRCKTLIKWFLPIQKDKLSRKTVMASLINECDVKAIILSLAHCYHSRFFDKTIRLKYRRAMETVFKGHGYVYSEDVIAKFIKQEQNDILERMNLPPGTAKNTALQENVFVILVCILNRIPIFVVGKPGCSKSLAMQVIRSNLRGKDSTDEFFKTLPQLYCVSFQGSESSTSDGIIKVFEKAEKYQISNSQDEVLSVVILDEIGLAEISRFNPLKVLHNLLEPDGNSRPNVAVVGISNWSLDASKMNRAIHLSRPEMDVEELYETGLSISDSFTKTEKKGLLNTGKNMTYFKTEYIKDDLEGIAKSYTSYIRNLRFRNFHGLRDYYSLVKYIAKELSELDAIGLHHDKSDVIMAGIERNFGGLPLEKETLLQDFKINLKQLTSSQLPVVDLITANIKDELARHLMLITTGESVMGVLEKKLTEINREAKEVIFGSQFEEDLTDDYNYRILSRIILCM